VSGECLCEHFGIGNVAEFLAQASKGLCGLPAQVIRLSGCQSRGWCGVGLEEGRGEGGRNRTLVMLRSSSKRSSCKRLDNFKAPTLRHLARVSFWR
jgi:hypothetical protein